MTLKEKSRHITQNHKNPDEEEHGQHSTELAWTMVVRFVQNREEENREPKEISVSFYVLDDKGSPLGDELYLGD